MLSPRFEIEIKPLRELVLVGWSCTGDWGRVVVGQCCSKAASGPGLHRSAAADTAEGHRREKAPAPVKTVAVAAPRYVLPLKLATTTPHLPSVEQD